MDEITKKLLRSNLPDKPAFEYSPESTVWKEYFKQIEPYDRAGILDYMLLKQKVVYALRDKDVTGFIKAGEEYKEIPKEYLDEMGILVSNLAAFEMLVTGKMSGILKSIENKQTEEGVMGSLSKSIELHDSSKDIGRMEGESFTDYLLRKGAENMNFEVKKKLAAEEALKDFESLGFKLLREEAAKDEGKYRIYYRLQSLGKFTWRDAKYAAEQYKNDVNDWFVMNGYGEVCILTRLPFYAESQDVSIPGWTDAVGCDKCTRYFDGVWFGKDEADLYECHPVVCIHCE